MKYNNSIIKMCLGIFLVFVLTLSAHAQKTQTYKGVVLDEAEQPIIGAAVKVVGTTIGVITDFDGKFSLSVPEGKIVEVTFVGYVPQKISDFKKATIILKEDAQLLDEVIVVGYGTQKKAHLTGAISTVSMNDIQDLSGGGLASSLSGMVNGLSVSGGQSRPGENARIYIRDTKSLGDVNSDSQEPLYVIDGYIYPNDMKVGNSSENLGAAAFNNLDPSVIESISVLKDAAAAVYGARAANGVILVTTKKGQLGAPQVSYNATLGIADEVSRTKMLSAYNYGRLYNAVALADPTLTSNHTTDLFQTDELEAMKGLNYDLLDKYWKTAFTMKHSVNISGATEKASYFADISYFTQDGNLGRLDYNRWNFRSGVDVKVSKWLRANLTVSGDYGKKNTPNVKVGGTSDEKDYNLLLTRPYYIPEEINGKPITAYGVSNKEVDGNQNYSYSVLQNSGDYSRNMTSNMSVNGSLEYDFGWNNLLKGLKMRFSYSKSINSDKNNQYGSEYNIYHLADRSGSGSHLYTPVSGQDYDSIISEDNFSSSTISNGSPSYLSRNTSRTDNYQMNFTASYARDFGQHHIGGLFSIEKSEAESEYLYGYVSDPYTFTTGQSNSAEANTESTTFTRSESGTMSYIGRLNYAYADKYLFEALLRSDSSTKFAPENYWGMFPSASIGWIISQESWMKKVSWVDYLKVRASFGLTGRDNTYAWQWMQVYAQDANKGPMFGTNTGNGTENRITINKTNSAVNRDVHWDKSYKANFGIDLNTLNNRLSFNVDGYYTMNREMLMNISQSIPGIVGTQSAALNVGEMDNYGVEFSATWRDKIGKDFKYKIGINTGYTDNKVLNMDWDTQYLYRQITKGHRSDVGTWGMQCVGMFRSFQDIEEYFTKNNITSYMGRTKDQVRPGMLMYKDVRGAQQANGSYAGPDGIVDKDNDQVQLSNRSNPYAFTTNLSAEWKGISLTAQISASWGGYSMIPSAALKPGSSSSSSSSTDTDNNNSKIGLEYTNMPSFWDPDNMFVYNDIYDGSGNLVMAANRDANLPNLRYSSVNSVASTFWRVSGTRVQLNRLTLAYAIPSRYIKLLGIQSCRFNVTGQNLLSFYNPYPDNFMDPMNSYGSYPTLRKLTIGVNLTF
ncbi:SusC/RagA family TonB-linked outer membrane protein [Bacteroides ihuae]|uniref:SusC/RagA family TonB-linked outer membrane protein n=1 Tax=Bacteroides ihuae TaxID=1852362 RepID=UPI0008D9CD96|nr:TonB-dependent receptor [Bacteroides ihuae]